MGLPAAKAGDRILATDIHIILVPPNATPTPIPHPFVGMIDGSLVDSVRIGGQSAAVVGSTASNTPAHIPQGGPFQSPPSNRATIQKGSATVRIGGKPAARHGDIAMTCNDPSDLPAGQVVAVGSVMIGG